LLLGLLGGLLGGVRWELFKERLIVPPEAWRQQGFLKATLAFFEVLCSFPPLLNRVWLAAPGGGFLLVVGSFLDDGGAFV
jgi:hypothetical protein